MLVDGLNLLEGSSVNNLVIVSGENFPSLPNLGELFFKTGATPGMHTYTGTEWQLVGTGAAGSGSSGGGATPYDIVVSIENKPTANASILISAAARAFTIPGSLAGSTGVALDTASSTSIFTVFRNGISIGTITFATGAATPTFAGAGGAFAIGDVLRIASPPIQDSTLANVGITIIASLT